MFKATFRSAALLFALLVPATASATTAQDPWPGSEVLTRLFVLQPTDGARLVRELGLTPAQAAELRRMAGSERSYGQAGRQVLGRAEAQHLNGKLAEMRTEKDRKTRLALGGRYPAFRDWVRGWWAGEVRRSGGRN